VAGSQLVRCISSVKIPLYKFPMRSSYSWPRVQVAGPMGQSHHLGPAEYFHQHSHPRQLKPSLVLISSLLEPLPLVWEEL
jgi:hypothetical protein